MNNLILIAFISGFILFAVFNLFNINIEMLQNPNKPIEAIAVFFGPIKGYVTFRENLLQKNIKISANLSGLPPNSQLAWHIHEAGDLRDPKCKSACDHYNPFHKTHAGPLDKNKHVGDLGNIKINSQGVSKSTLTTSDVKLKGKYSVIGRSLIIHAKKDDLGKGGTEESLKTGSAGARIACAVIGYSKNSKLYF